MGGTEHAATPQPRRIRPIRGRPCSQTFETVGIYIREGGFLVSLTLGCFRAPGPSSSKFAKKLDFVQKSGISAKNLDFSKKNRISGSFFMDFTVGAHGRLELQKSGISDISEIQLFCTKSLFFAQNPAFLQNQMAKNLNFRVHTVGAHQNPGFLSVGG